MDIEIREIRKKDFNLAKKFAVEGMNLKWYTSNTIELYLYSKYFWYLEISKATKALGAYIEDELVGVLLVDMINEKKIFNSIFYKIFINLSRFIINLGYKEAAGPYEKSNIEILNEFKSKNKVDGEINFFAVNPKIKGKGIGSLLLKELEKEEKNKLIYLFTDTGSTYQFYLKRGFYESDRRDVILNISGKDVPLTCFLFSKRL